jgi:hypothetical protein
VQSTGLSYGGFNQPGSAFAAYRAAIHTKWGSNGAAAPSNNSQPAPWTGGGAPNNVNGGVTVSHYGYEKPGDRYYDSNSAAGIGAFPFSSAPGSLRSGLSAALSQDVADKYHVQPGDGFNATLANGQTLSLVYADKVGHDDSGNPLLGRIDVYDPSDSLGSLSGVNVTGVNDTGVDSSVSNRGGGFMGLLSRTGDAVVMALAGPVMYLVSLLAAAIMYLMSLVQAVLYLAEVAISPVFIGMLIVPELVPIASSFLASLVALTLWPLGWAVSDLITRALVDGAVNPASNVGQAMLTVTGAPWALWMLLAVWVIGSSIFAPIIISRWVTGGRGGTGLGQVLTASFLAASNVARPGSLAQRGAGAALNAGKAISSAVQGANGSTGSTPTFASRMPFRGGAARRPVASAGKRS